MTFQSHSYARTALILYAKYAMTATTTDRMKMSSGLRRFLLAAYGFIGQSFRATRRSR